MFLDTVLKIKALTEAGSFEAFAAIYGEKDLQGDIVLRGSFAQSIHSQGDGYPLLWAHDQAKPIGLATISDSASALVVHGRLDLDDAEGRAAYNRVRKKYVRGLSIGYLPPDPAKVAFRDGARILKEITVAELSLVSVPAQRGAQIQNVKSLADVQSVLNGLDADRLAPEMLRELQAIHLAVKALVDRDGEAARDVALLAALRDCAAALRTP